MKVAEAGGQTAKVTTGGTYGEFVATAWYATQASAGGYKWFETGTFVIPVPQLIVGTQSAWKIRATGNVEEVMPGEIWLVYGDCTLYWED